MGAYAEQLRSDHLARRARLGMTPTRAVVDRRTIPAMRKIDKVDPQVARAILADEILKNWPVMAAVSGQPVEWHCSMPEGLLRIAPNLTELEDAPKIQKPTMRSIVALVCREFDATVAEVTGRSRSIWAIFPRQVAMYLGYRGGLSSPHVAKYLGGRDHTTALYGRRKIEERVRTDPELAATIARLEAKLPK